MMKQEITFPKLNDILSVNEIKIIKETYELKIKIIDKIQHKKLLEIHLKNLNCFYLDQIGEVLDDIEEDLPKEIRDKLHDGYKKWTKVKI